MYIGTYCTSEIKIQIPHYDGWKKPHYKWEINVREQSLSSEVMEVISEMSGGFPDK